MEWKTKSITTLPPGARARVRCGEDDPELTIVPVMAMLLQVYGEAEECIERTVLGFLNPWRFEIETADPDDDRGWQIDSVCIPNAHQVFYDGASDSDFQGVWCRNDCRYTDFADLLEKTGQQHDRVYATNTTVPASGIPNTKTKPRAAQPDMPDVAVRQNPPR